VTKYDDPLALETARGPQRGCMVEAVERQYIGYTESQTISDFGGDWLKK